LCALSAVSLPIQHWMPHDFPGESQFFQHAMVFVHFFVSRLAVGFLMWVVGYLDGRLQRTSQQFVVQCMLIFGMYLLMSWPGLFAVTQGMATFHRWSCVAYIGYRIVQRSCTSTGIPGWVPALVCYLVAPLVGHMPLRVGFMDPAVFSIWQQPLLVLTDAEFNGTVGFIVRDCGNYLIACYIGMTKPEIVQKALGRSRRSAILAGVAWIVLTASWSSMDVQFDSTLEANVADWPNYFDHWYPCRVLTEFLSVAMLVIFVGEGTVALRFLGRSLVGSFLVHMYIRPDIQGLIWWARPAGPLVQLALVFAIPVAYVATFGAAVQMLIMEAVKYTRAFT